MTGPRVAGANGGTPIVRRMSSTVTRRSQSNRARRRDQHEGGRSRPLRGEEKARLGLLALPTFALALSITMVSTYLSTVTRRYTQQTVVIGAIIGGEGVMALWIPLIAGAWSDTLRTRIGGRLPFVLAGTVPAAIALALIGLLHSLGLVALVAAVFFAFYFVAYEPYRAMYPDMLDDENVAGRAQSTQALARGLGTGCALLGGGLLLSVARPLPFAVAAVILVAAVGAFVLLILRRGLPDQAQEDAEGPAQVARRLPRLMKEHPALRAYFVANALWEMALAGLKAFVVLYLTIGLHYKLPTASLMIGAVALVILIGAGATGKAGDKWGRIRVVKLALWGYGLGFVVLIVTTSRPLLAAALPFIAIGGGAVMTMAYAILMPLMPEEEHGALTGFYSLSRGVGITLGPVLAGILISVTGSGPFKGTQGFQAMWIVCAAAALTSLLFLHKLQHAEDDRRRLEDQ
jgi:MFS family permease